MNEVYLIGSVLIATLNGRHLILADDVDLTEACEVMLDFARMENKPFAQPVRRKLGTRRAYQRNKS